MILVSRSTFLSSKNLNILTTEPLTIPVFEAAIFKDKMATILAHLVIAVVLDYI